MSLLIRPYVAEDGPDLYEAVRESIDHIQPFMPWCHPGYSLEDANAWAARQSEAFRAGTEYDFVFDVDGRFAGAGGLNSFDLPNKRANLGYWMRASEARKGYATRAVQLIREWAFANTDFVRLEIIVAVDNVASRRVAEKIGALREGVLRKRVWLHGAAHDAISFSLTR